MYSPRARGVPSTLAVSLSRDTEMPRGTPGGALAALLLPSGTGLSEQVVAQRLEYAAQLITRVRV